MRDASLDRRVTRGRRVFGGRDRSIEFSRVQWACLVVNGVGFHVRSSSAEVLLFLSFPSPTAAAGEKRRRIAFDGVLLDVYVMFVKLERLLYEYTLGSNFVGRGRVGCKF